MRFLRARHFFVSASFGLYFLFSLIQLELPGLEYDEVLFANAAMGNVDGSFVEWEFRIGGQHLPIMLMTYIGALKAYLYAPIFALFGSSVASARVPVIIVGLITLTFTYKLVGAMIGREIALLSLVLLATDPTFIFATSWIGARSP